MNVLGLVASLLHIILLVSVYLVVPELVSPEKTEDVQHWVLVSFSIIFLLLITVSAKDKINIFVLLLIGAIVITGLVWWVPAYIPKDKQDLASHILIVSSSVFITLISVVYSLRETETLGLQETSTFEGLIGGKRRRRH